MKLMRIVGLSALALALSSTLPAAGAEAGAEAGATAMAADFTLPCVDGEKHALSEYRGKWVVLEWVNFDCPFVKKQYQSGAMPKRQAHFIESGVVWLSICSSAPGKQGHFEGAALKARLASEKHAGSEYLIDSTGSVGRSYGAKTTPHIFVIDPQGRLVYEGAIDDLRSTDMGDIFVSTNYVVETLTAAREEREIPHPKTRPYGCSVKY